MVTLIPLLPFLAFWRIVFGGRRLPGDGAYVAVGALALSGLLSLVILGQVMFGGRYQASMVWAALGDRTLTVGYAVDPLSAVMLFVVTVVGSLIFVYSIGYMRGDPRYPRFFAYLSLFAASMLLLVLANNFLVLYAGWELVGLCSYLLIGFWFERPAAARASMKAFVTTRVGDFFMFLGILLLFFTVGSLQFDAVFAAVQTYSTISQLGYMMLGLGVLGYTAGVFHLMTHAFFKALLFLAAGSVIHAMNTNDIKEMGGLAKVMPVTYVTMLVGGLALAGVPPFAGFWSKDEILLEAYHHDRTLFYLGAAGAFVTAFYVFRMIFFTFPGSLRSHEAHPHESPRVMAIPPIILAAFSGAIGLVGAPWPVVGNAFHRVVHFEGDEGAPFDLNFAAISPAIAGAGILAAAVVYRWRWVSSAMLRRTLAPLYAVLVHKYWWDEFYVFTVVRPVVWVARQLRTFDIYVIDGAVNAVGIIFVWLSRLYRVFDLYVVDGAVNLVGWLARATGGALRHVQTGRAQNYLLVLALGVIVLAVIGVSRQAAVGSRQGAGTGGAATGGPGIRGPPWSRRLT